MPARRLTTPLLTLTVLFFVALALAWLHHPDNRNIGSITVKLPPAHSSARPGFKF